MNTSSKKIKKIEPQQIKEEIGSKPHQSKLEISREKKVIMGIKMFSFDLTNIFTEIKSATSEYCSKINQIIEKLKTSNSNLNIEKHPELNIQNNLYKIIKHFIELVQKNFINVEIENTRSEKDLISIEEQINQLEEILHLDIDKMEFTKQAYEQEFQKYELYLIKNELYNKAIEYNEKDINNDKENNNEEINENVKRLLSLQKAYLNINQKLKLGLKNIFDMMNIERKYLFKTINDSFGNFLNNIYSTANKINKILDEEKINKLEVNNEDFAKQIEEKINNVFNEEIYEFKFLEQFNPLREEEEIMKKNKKGIDNLLDKLSDKNIKNIAKKLKKCSFCFCQENLQQLKLMETNEKIISIISLILNTPMKFNEKEKKELLSLLKSSSQNQLLFLRYLNNYRATGNLNLKKETISIFCELFLFIINLGIQNNNFKAIQLSIILCQTYYHEIDDNSKDKDNEKKKIYMINYMKNSNIFKDKTFWKNYLKGLIDDEIKKIIVYKNKNKPEKQKSIAVYSSIFTLTKNMVDFDLDMDFISSLNNEAFEVYNIPDDQKKDIINYLIVELQTPKNVVK